MRHHDQLPKKARNIFETKIIVTKALPKPEDQDYKIRRRRFNKQLDIAAKQYKIEAIHVSDILPSDADMFEGPDLSEAGKRKFWKVIGDKVKELNTSDAEALIKRRNERILGDMPVQSSANNWMWLNTRRRHVNRNNYILVLSHTNIRSYMRQDVNTYASPN